MDGLHRLYRNCTRRLRVKRSFNDAVTSFTNDLKLFVALIRVGSNFWLQNISSQVKLHKLEMIDCFYKAYINKLLLRYLKFNRDSSFTRLAAYATLWKYTNEETRLMQAFFALRHGHPYEPYLPK